MKNDILLVAILFILALLPLASIIYGSNSEQTVPVALEEIEYVMPNGKTVHCFVYIDPENKSKRRIPVSCEYKS